MALASIEQVRQLGGLPPAAKLADAKITPHLEAAARELRRKLGDYSSRTGDERADCIDAECSIALAYLIPVLNIICPEGLNTVQKEYGDLGLNFYDADDQKTLIKMWRDRADSAIARIQNERPPQGVPSIGWNVL
jgi:hypothetical protein